MSKFHNLLFFFVMQLQQSHHLQVRTGETRSMSPVWNFAQEISKTSAKAQPKKRFASTCKLTRTMQKNYLCLVQRITCHTCCVFISFHLDPWYNKTITLVLFSQNELYIYLSDSQVERVLMQLLKDMWKELSSLTDLIIEII